MNRVQYITCGYCETKQLFEGYDRPCEMCGWVLRQEEDHIRTTVYENLTEEQLDNILTYLLTSDADEVVIEPLDSP